MKITFVGTGYVGLVSGACLSELGHHVTCLDTDVKKIESLSQGKCPIYEPDLQHLIVKNLREARLQFSTDWSSSLSSSDVVFIAVGTPTSRRGNGYADMNYVYEATRSLAPYLGGYTVVVNKSTVPVGSARQVARIIREQNPVADFDVVSNPEFLREGVAVYDFLHPDRIVFGVESSRACEILKQIYAPLLKSSSVIVTTPETAELIKYASNAFLATKISFVNEMANLCETVGAHIDDLTKGIGLDHRIGPKFLHPGPGFGGSCLPKDTLALARIAQEYGVASRLVETVVEINHAQKARMVRKISDALGNTIVGKTVAVLGLTYKPDTDDMREAPSLTILPALIEKGIMIRAHDPVGMEEARKHLPDITYCPDLYACCEGADAVCLLTDWNVYRELDLKRIRQLLKKPLFIDLRNICDPCVMKEAGFYYISIGRKDVNGLA